MTDADRAEEIRFRDWLRTLDAQPTEVADDSRWNHDTIVNTWEYVIDSLPADDTDGCG